MRALFPLLALHSLFWNDPHIAVNFKALAADGFSGPRGRQNRPHQRPALVRSDLAKLVHERGKLSGRHRLMAFRLRDFRPGWLMLKVAIKPGRIVPSAQPLVLGEVENLVD